MKTCIMTNLNEYENIKLKKPMEIILLSIPSKEKISIEELNKSIVLSFNTKEEKSIFVLNIDSPNEQIDDDKIEVKSISKLQK